MNDMPEPTNTSSQAAGSTAELTDPSIQPFLIEVPETDVEICMIDLRTRAGQMNCQRRLEPRRPARIS